MSNNHVPYCSIGDSDNSMTLIVVANAKRIIKDKGLLIGEIERSLGLTLGYFNRIEKTHTTISIDKVAKLSQILEVPLTDLIDRKILIENLRDQIAILENIYK